MGAPHMQEIDRSCKRAAPGEEERDIERASLTTQPVDKDPNIVTWYGDRDPANPLNWSLFKKCFVTFEMCLLTFSIYIGSA